MAPQKRAQVTEEGLAGPSGQFSRVPEGTVERGARDAKCKACRREGRRGTEDGAPPRAINGGSELGVCSRAGRVAPGSSRSV